MQKKGNPHKILTTSLVLGYLYLLMTTTFYGYGNYFNLPLTDSQFSPQVPFLFFFDLSRIVTGVISNLSLLVIGTYLFLFIIAVLVYFLVPHGKNAALLCGIGLLVYLPFGFYNFGGTLATFSTEFYTAPSECIPGATDSLYIAPALYGDLDQIVFISIDPESRTLLNGLLPRDASDLGCQLTKQNIGKIIKP